jgi:type IV secretory pathway TrbF-like protein
MFKSFLLFVSGLLLYINIVIGYITLNSAETELFIAILSGMLSVIGLVGMIYNSKQSKV